jgi:hypothetical protein
VHEKRNSEYEMKKMEVAAQEEQIEELTTDRGFDETPAMRSEMH